MQPACPSFITTCPKLSSLLPKPYPNSLFLAFSLRLISPPCLVSYQVFLVLQNALYSPLLCLVCHQIMLPGFRICHSSLDYSLSPGCWSHHDWLEGPCSPSYPGQSSTAHSQPIPLSSRIRRVWPGAQC